MNSVALDVTRVKNPWSGLGQYAIHLANAIAQSESKSIEPVLYLHDGDQKHFPSLPIPKSFAEYWHKEKFRPLLSRIPILRNSLSQFSLWHTFDQLSSYAPLSSKVPIVLTIHDLNFPDRSEKSRTRGLQTVQKRVDRASGVATISEYSAQQIHQFLDLKGKPLRVIPSGHCLDQTVVARRPQGISETPFLFSIGEFRTTKNFHLLVSLVELLPEYHLVIAGHYETAYGQKVIDQIVQSPASARIHLLGRIPDEERRWLYENCKAFLFPSVAEGFGLPVVEAMSCGRPVFTTKAMSLPEVAGDCGIYWESLETRDMLETFQEGIDQVEANPDFSQQLIAHAQQFDWQKTATAYLELYNEIIQ